MLLTTRATKAELADRVATVIEPRFVDDRIRPLIDVNGEAYATEVIQLDGTGAATVRLAFGSRADVYAKLYPTDDGQQIYDKLRYLRGNGFGPGSRYQAVEPMAFFPELSMLVARAAPGVAVSSMIDGRGERLAEGIREAARWLASLHSSPVRIGRPHSLLVSGELLSLARRLSKVVAERPSHLSVALDMIRRLESLAEETVDGLLVQSHGQYRPIHVFCTLDTVTVIDLDRSRPCDPARDVAEFVHRLRMTFNSRHGATAEADDLTATFIETYRSGVPGPHLANLRFHWARYICHSLNNKLKGTTDDTPAGATLDFYQSEFEQIVEGRGIAADLP